MIFGFGNKPQKQEKPAVKQAQKAEEQAEQRSSAEKIVECVPNFSVGHDSTVIHKIVDAIKASKVDVIDQSYDEDHNRLVVTFIGTPENVLGAAYNSIDTASKLIDINKQVGVHPFIGVVDVVPFIPLQNSNMNDCKELAKKLGKMVADKLNIPSYLYGEAARNDKFKHLSNIRHGGLHHLKNTIATNDFKPDFGPQNIHPTAGAIAIGARDFLIAFNFNLETSDLQAAKDIAKKIREKDGGLPGIRALGVPIHSKKNVQVTVNLTHYKKTGLKTLMDRVKKECAAKGINILNTELVGLIPNAATFPGMKEYLLLDDFDEGKIIETYL
jgi:glutamate formiminotransferase / 5-formyltetrahydrofolate cyclo-ligase